MKGEDISGKYSSLFQPLNIGNLEIKNRIGMAPMAPSGMCTSDNCFNQRAVDYYVERARGGVGLIITGGIEVENVLEETKEGLFQNVGTNPEAFVLLASEMTERVHAYGAKIFLQITMGFGRVSFYPDMVRTSPIAPSPVSHFWQKDVMCRELTTQEVEYLVKKMGDAAKVAAESGFDGVEIHAMHEGYLIDQFTMAAFNQRTDKYGGNLKDRLTLPIEILKEIKMRVGRNFPVILRFGVKSCIKALGEGGLPGEDYVEMGRDVEESYEAAKILEEAGYDGFNADLGSYEALYWAHPPVYMEHGCYLPYVEKLKNIVKIPILVAGRMDSPDLAEEAIVNNQVDMVLIGRGLLADPDWPNKVQANRINKIRPCLGCHDGCMGRLETKKIVSCAVNPACSRENDYRLYPALVRKKIMVIGGGIAGMEVARAAAIRKHRVVLYEKGSALGGHMLEASIPEFKKDERDLLAWYENELKENSVSISLDTLVDEELVNQIAPDEIIVATGAIDRIPQLKGIEGSNVLTACDALKNMGKVRKRVVIIGGGLVGCEIAIWLKNHGRDVTIVEMMDRILDTVFISHSNKMMLVDLIKYNGISVKTSACVQEIKENSMEIVNDNGESEIIQADTVICAVGYLPEKQLYNRLRGHYANVHLIGDASKVRNIHNAIWDGYEVGRTI